MQGIEQPASYKQYANSFSFPSDSASQSCLYGERKTTILGKRKSTEMETNDHCSVRNHELKKRKTTPEKSELRSIGNGLVVKHSALPGSRNGVFVSHDVSAGEFITWYDGTVIDVSAEERRELLTDYEYWSHLISIDQYTLIQGIKKPPSTPGFGLGSLINDGPISGIPDNVEFVKLLKQKEVYIKAKRFIKKGEELFVSYGKSYWDRFQKQFPEEYDRIHIGKRRVCKPTFKIMKQYA